MTRPRLTICSFAAVLGAVLSIADAPVRADSDKELSFTAVITSADPCTGEGVSGSLDVVLVANRASTGSDQIRVNVHGSFHGQLVGNLGTTYQVSAAGSGRFDFVSGHYDFPFSTEGISHNSAPNLTLDGVARLFVNGEGDPTGGTIVSVSATCH